MSARWLTCICFHSAENQFYQPPPPILWSVRIWDSLKFKTHISLLVLCCWALDKQLNNWTHMEILASRLSLQRHLTLYILPFVSLDSHQLLLCASQGFATWDEFPSHNLIQYSTLFTDLDFVTRFNVLVTFDCDVSRQVAHLSLSLMKSEVYSTLQLISQYDYQLCILL